MAPPAAGPNAKHYILAALAATLTSAAVVTVVFVVLSPARIHFSVTKAGNHRSSDGGVQLILTVAANNTSQRAAVKYQSLFVDVSNNTGDQWVYWIRANVSAALPLLQPKSNVTAINASVPLVGGPWANAFTHNRTSHNFTVMVTTVARFKVGISWTRLYDIKVSCGSVNFFSEAGHNSTAGWPAVNCEAS